MTYGVSVEDTIYSLVQFAAFLAENKERLEGVDFDIEFGVMNVEEHELAALLKCPRPFDSRWTKDYSGQFFHLSTNFGAVAFEAIAAREQVCKAVPTGRTTTEKRVKVAAEYEDVEVPEVEWVCAPVLSEAAS